MNRLDEAIAELELSLQLAPGAADAECTLATCYLLKGDFRRGWPALEARLRLPGAKKFPNLPRWQGQDLSGRRLLLVAEQGVGDALQMLRFARLLKARGAAHRAGGAAAAGPAAGVASRRRRAVCVAIAPCLAGGGFLSSTVQRARRWEPTLPRFPEKIRIFGPIPD